MNMISTSIAALLFLVRHSSATICHFDASCKCTSPPPHLGQVDCINTRVSLGRINSSKLFSFNLVNNQIDYLPPSLFEGTGLYRFRLSQNPVYQLDEDVFKGIERSLWELHLSYCKLSTVPYKAIRHLQKLKTLNLTGNAIINISQDQLRGVASSLQVLILAENRISSLPDGVFSVLQSLETLNLRGNALFTLEPASFSPAPPRLSSLDLADNNLRILNYQQLSNIRTLSYLDVSMNYISDLADANATAFRLTLDSLYLDYNNITELGSNSMINFFTVNKTSFRGNPLNYLHPNAFQPCRIEELYLTDCELSSIAPEAFNGLDDTLRVLDLSGNNISTFEFPITTKFSYLTTFRANHNKLAQYDWLSPPGKMPYTNNHLLELSIMGKKNGPVNLQKLPRLPHLHTLAISKSSTSTLDPEQLNKLSVELETLKIEEGSIRTLSNGMFKNVRGIKTLDLTDNSIESIELGSFTEVSHSLEKLILTHAFSQKIGNFPNGLLRQLTSLAILKINHNHLRKLPNDLRALTSLEIFHAHDNLIDVLPNSLFESNAHKRLSEIILSFNKISKVQENTFFDLERLKTIDLSDNDITTVATGAFKNLPAVKLISLRGNKLSSLEKEAFQNLPYLENLDVSYNSLFHLSMTSMDQVGTLTTMALNASHNSITSLKSIGANEGGRYLVYGTIKVLDFSHNKITDVDGDYFGTTQDSLSQLILSHNLLRNLSRNMLPELRQLQYLDVSSNLIFDVEFDALRNLPLLQTFFIGGNTIKDLPTGLFSSSIHYMECLDFSRNSLSSLTDSLIATSVPIKVDISNNGLTKVPLSTFSPSSSANVQELLLRSNKISKLPSFESFSRFSGLRHLDLSDNKLTELGNAFGSLPCLTKLSLSYNRIRFEVNDWRNQERSLKHLDLSNTSLSYVPALPLPSLLTLKLSYNGIAYIPPDLQTNLTNLKMLDVSYNILTEMTPFPQLVFLNLAANPINTIANSTFSFFTSLADLDICQLPLTFFDTDSLGQLDLITLAISNYQQVGRFSIPLWIRDITSLRHLIYESTGTSIGNEIQGPLTPKIKHVTIRGAKLKSIPSSLLQEHRRPEIVFSLENTSVESLDRELFRSPFLRNVTLDLRSASLKSVGNPCNVARPNVPHSVFLIDMHLHSTELICNCEIGWIETWNRKRRQQGSPYLQSEDLRTSVCKKTNQNLMNTLKSDIECGWSGVGRISNTIVQIIVIMGFAYLL